MRHAHKPSYMPAQCTHPWQVKLVVLTRGVSVGDEDQAMLPKTVSHVQVHDARGGRSSNWLASSPGSMAGPSPGPDPSRVLVCTGPTGRPWRWMGQGMDSVVPSSIGRPIGRSRYSAPISHPRGLSILHPARARHHDL